MSFAAMLRRLLALAVALLVPLAAERAAHAQTVQVAKAGAPLGLRFQTTSLCPPGCECLTGPEAETRFGTGAFQSCSDSPCGHGWQKDLLLPKYCYSPIPTGECMDTDAGKDYAVKGMTPGCVDQCSEFSHPPTVLKECYAEVVDGQCKVSVDYHFCNSACQDGRCLPASCDDWLQNQREAGVDCGGPCDARCVCPAGYKCASTESAEAQFGEGGFVSSSDEMCDFSGPRDKPSDVKFCYKKVDSSDCIDTDGGADVFVQGRAPACEDRCTSDRELLECTVNPLIDGCETHSSPWTCEGRCVDGACRQATCDDGIQNQDEIAVDCSAPSIFADCDSCCGNGVRDPGEEDVDCGGPRCLPCGFVGVAGRILYEDSSSVGGGVLKPVRHGNFYLRLCSSHPCTAPTHQAPWVTDSQGHFSFLFPKGGFASAFIRLGHEDDDDPYQANYAVRITKDLDDCHETVWWHSDPRQLPPSGFLNFGDLRVGKDSNFEFVGRWQEETDAATCGGGDDEQGEIAGGSAYFNIADVILYARQYADARRSDDDAVSYVDVEWPDASDASHYSAGWEEITLREDRGFHDGKIVHEYGHYLQDAIGTNDDYWGSSSHSFCTEGKDEEFAWKEGFAEYFGTVVPHRYAALTPPNVSFTAAADAVAKIEAPYCFENSGLDDCCDWVGKEAEATVAAVLWDLADAPSTHSGSVFEFHDTLGGGETLIFNIFDDELDNGDSVAADAPDLCEFIEQGVNCRVDEATRDAFREIWKHYVVICSSACDD